MSSPLRFYTFNAAEPETSLLQWRVCNLHGAASSGCRAGIMSVGQGGDGVVRHGRNTTQHDATAPTRAPLWLERLQAEQRSAIV
jgi:hypothetical protein